MIGLKINNIKQVTQTLEKVKNHAQFSTAIAINRTLFDMRQAEIAEIKKSFKSPIPFTLKGVIFDKAKYPSSMTGRLKLLDFVGKGTAPADYLTPHIEGGDRKLKRSEYWLRDKGLLPHNKYIAPTSELRLNKYGNITRGKMTQILSGLKAFSAAGFDANITAQSKAKNPGRATYFVPRKESTLPSGVWQRSRAGRIKPLLWFISKPHYKKRYDFYGVGYRAYLKVYDRNYNKAYSDGLKKIIK